MKTIYKYRLNIMLRQDVMMHLGAQVLDVQMQGDTMCLWALVDPRAPVMAHGIVCVGTGQGIPDEPYRYLSTVQKNSYVWHFFADLSYPAWSYAQ